MKEADNNLSEIRINGFILNEYFTNMGMKTNLRKIISIPNTDFQISVIIRFADIETSKTYSSYPCIRLLYPSIRLVIHNNGEHTIHDKGKFLEFYFRAEVPNSSVLIRLANELDFSFIHRLLSIDKTNIPTSTTTFTKWIEAIKEYRLEDSYCNLKNIVEDSTDKNVIDLTEEDWQEAQTGQGDNIKPYFKESTEEHYLFDKQQCNQFGLSLRYPEYEWCSSSSLFHSYLRICSFRLYDKYYTGLQEIFLTKDELEQRMMKYITKLKTT